MKNFLKGIFLVALVLPLIDGLTSIFNQAVEYICMKIASKTVEIQKTIAEQASQEEVCTNVVGFQVPNPIEEEEEI